MENNITQTKSSHVANKVTKVQKAYRVQEQTTPEPKDSNPKCSMKKEVKFHNYFQNASFQTNQQIRNIIGLGDASIKEEQKVATN